MGFFMAVKQNEINFNIDRVVLRELMAYIDDWPWPKHSDIRRKTNMFGAKVQQHLPECTPVSCWKYQTAVKVEGHTHFPAQLTLSSSV